MEELITFDEIIDKLDRPKLLLGNGFSIAYNPERFSFTSLLDSAVENKIIEKDSKVYQIFNSLKTADFESVMRALDDTKKIVDVYGGGKELLESLNNDGEELKKHLVEIITNNHPSKSTHVSEPEKLSCSKFLNNFEAIYTLNYDLLLYWAILQEDRVKDKFKDGFGEDNYSADEDYVVYKNDKSFKLHFLHGGLHIFDAGSNIIKKTYSKTEIDLITQIRTNLDIGIYPIFISEGNSQQKMTKILHSGYLSHCYKSFKNITKDLVIYGTNLKENDNHILNAIIASPLKNIYIGVSNLENINHIEERIREFNQDKKPYQQKLLIPFDYKSINPWNYYS